jgi:hypothetical protein
VATYIPTIQPDVFSQNCPLINQTRVFGEFIQNQAGISASIVPNGYINQGLRIDFTNVSGVGGNYAGWEVWLGADDQSGVPFSAYNSLVFYIRGQAGGEEPNVYLMMPNTGTNFQRYWKDVELVAPLTTSWTRIEIPLLHFTSSQEPNQQVNLSNIQRIQFLFEWYAQPTSGTIFIDDLCVQ